MFLSRYSWFCCENQGTLDVYLAKYYSPDLSPVGPNITWQQSLVFFWCPMKDLALPGPLLLKVLSWGIPVADGCNCRHFHLVSAKCPWLLHLLCPNWYPLTLPYSGEEVSILYMNLEERVTKSEIVSRIQPSHRQLPALPKWFPTWFSQKSF